MNCIAWTLRANHNSTQMQTRLHIEAVYPRVPDYRILNPHGITHWPNANSQTQTTIISRSIILQCPLANGRYHPIPFILLLCDLESSPRSIDLPSASRQLFDEVHGAQSLEIVSLGEWRYRIEGDMLVNAPNVSHPSLLMPYPAAAGRESSLEIMSNV
jgi:hypothetical protein